MWTCPSCDRIFKVTNQSHICVKKDIGELFIGKPDELVLAFDAIFQQVMEWQPNVASASTKSIVFTSKKAWLIVKPMKDQLDLKIYLSEKLTHPLVKKHTAYGNKTAHHFRVKTEWEVDKSLLLLLREGFEYSIRN